VLQVSPVELVAAGLLALVAIAVAVATGRRSRTGDPMGRIVEGVRSRRWARSLLSLLSFALLAGAVGVLGYPIYTDVYQGRIQARLDRQFASAELEQAYAAGQLQEGDSLTRIQIPAIGVDVVVVQGTSADALRAGAGHYPASSLPCDPGNVAIAGHRTTYGKPFSGLDKLKPGDVIVLTTPVGQCTYTVREAPFVVQPTERWVVDPTPESILTLTTCHPRGSAKQRLIVRADLQGPAAPA
jgi:sortase A